MLVVAVKVGVKVMNGSGVKVWVIGIIGVRVKVGVTLVGSSVLVALGVGVNVQVAVALGVSVGVAVPVAVSVAVADGVKVGVGVAVSVGVSVGVGVNVMVAVLVGVGVAVRVGGCHCVGVGFKVFGGLVVPGPTRIGVLEGTTGEVIASGVGMAVGGGGRMARATNPKQ
jgi:hypothetical protein